MILLIAQPRPGAQARNKPPRLRLCARRPKSISRDTSIASRVRNPSRPWSVFKVYRTMFVSCPRRKPSVPIARHARHVGLRCGSLGWNPARSSRPSYGYFSATAACISSFAAIFPPGRRRHRSGLLSADRHFARPGSQHKCRRRRPAGRPTRGWLTRSAPRQKVPAKNCRQADIYCDLPMERFAAPPCSFAKQRKEFAPWPWS